MALAERFSATPELIGPYLVYRRERLAARTRRRLLEIKQLNDARDALLADMDPGERRWHGQISDSSEKKLDIQYSAERGIYYGPSGCLKTARGRLFVPWPLPRRDIAFPHTLTDAANQQAAESSESDVEDDEQDDGQQGAISGRRLRSAAI